MQRTYSIVLVGAISTSLGCGPGGPPRFALSGQVTYDGQPVSDGTIGFNPADPASGNGVAANLVDGRYEILRSQGPTAGKYIVSIESLKATGKKIASVDGSPPGDQLVQYIPEVYNVRSTLETEITDDRDDLDFNLEKVAPGPRRR